MLKVIMRTYQDDDGKWNWVIGDENGNILAKSYNKFESRDDAVEEVGNIFEATFMEQGGMDKLTDEEIEDLKT